VGTSEPVWSQLPEVNRQAAVRQLVLLASRAMRTVAAASERGR
jgi:hypothetical protein